MNYCVLLHFSVSQIRFFGLYFPRGSSVRLSRQEYNCSRAIKKVRYFISRFLVRFIRLVTIFIHQVAFARGKLFMLSTLYNVK